MAIGLHPVASHLQNSALSLSRFSSLIKRAVSAFNSEVSSGTGVTPLEYLKRYVTEGKQARVNSTGTDKRTAEKVEAQLEREKEIKPGMYVRLVSLAREKACTVMPITRANAHTWCTAARRVTPPRARAGRHIRARAVDPGRQSRTGRVPRIWVDLFRIRVIFDKMGTCIQNNPYPLPGTP